jgi:hypothetical protein
MLGKLTSRGSQGFTSDLQVGNLRLLGIAKGSGTFHSNPILLLPALLLLSPQRTRICSVAEKNSSRILSEQTCRHHTLRYHMGVRAYEYGFRRRPLIGISGVLFLGTPKTLVINSTSAKRRDMFAGSNLGVFAQHLFLSTGLRVARYDPSPPCRALHICLSCYVLLTHQAC